MSKPGLTSVWSLQQNPNPDPIADIDTLLINSLYAHRCIANDAVHLLSIIPSSEQNLRNNGIIGIYHAHRILINKGIEAAKQRGLTIPSLEPVPEDWKEETSLDPTTLHEMLRPHAAQAVKDYMEYTVSILNSRDSYHWTSMVAPYSVMMDIYNEKLSSTKAAAQTKQNKEPGSYMEALTDETLSPYADEVLSDRLCDAKAVIREEMMRLRENAEVSGWREEEAKQISANHFTILTKFFTVE